MKKRVVAEVLFVVIFAALAVAIGLSQTIAYVRETPEGFVFPLVHNYTEDFYYYLHVMRQGYDGMWKATSRLTPEYNPPQFVNPFFLTLGHLARITRTSLPFMYTAARAAGGFTLVVLTYFFVRKIFPDSLYKRILVMLTIFSGSYFWFWQGNSPKVAALVHEWTEFDPIFRLSYIPHHLWSKVLMIGIFLGILNALRNRKLLWAAVTFGMVVVMGFVSPVVLPTFVPVILIWFGFAVFTDRNKSSMKYAVILFSSLFLAAFAVAVYHRIVQNSVPPWTSYLWWEEVQYDVTILKYVATFGINILLFLLALPKIFTLKHFGGLLIAWFVTGFITLFILAPYIPLTNSRYMGGYQFIPVGIGASLFLFALAHLVHERMRIPNAIASVIVFTPVLLYNAVGFWGSWNEHRGYITVNRWNMQVYMPIDIWNILKFLNENNRGEVVVAPLELNTFIPAFTSGRTISGHKTITTDYPQKNQELAKFYSKEDSIWAGEFLDRYSAKYVVAYGTGPDDDIWYTNLGLTMVYNTPSIRIYVHP